MFELKYEIFNIKTRVFDDDRNTENQKLMIKMQKLRIILGRSFFIIQNLQFPKNNQFQSVDLGVSVLYNFLKLCDSSFYEVEYFAKNISIQIISNSKTAT